MITIGAILFIILTFPFWGFGTLAYLIIIGFVYFVGIVIVFLLDILEEAIGIPDAFAYMFVAILKLLGNQFFRFDDCFIILWKLANDYPGWAMAISGVLIWTYIYLIDEISHR